MTDPMRKEVSFIRKKIDLVNKELKPLGLTCQKKVTISNSRYPLQSISHNNNDNDNNNIYILKYYYGLTISSRSICWLDWVEILSQPTILMISFFNPNNSY